VTIRPLSGLALSRRSRQYNAWNGGTNGCIAVEPESAAAVTLRPAERGANLPRRSLPSLGLQQDVFVNPSHWGRLVPGTSGKRIHGCVGSWGSGIGYANGGPIELAPEVAP